MFWHLLKFAFYLYSVLYLIFFPQFWIYYVSKYLGHLELKCIDYNILLYSPFSLTKKTSVLSISFFILEIASISAKKFQWYPLMVCVRDATIRICLTVIGRICFAVKLTVWHALSIYKRRWFGQSRTSNTNTIFVAHIANNNLFVRFIRVWDRVPHD